MDDTDPAPVASRPRGKRRPTYTFAEGRYYPPTPIAPEVVAPADVWDEEGEEEYEDDVPRPALRRPIWWSYVLTAVVALAVGIVIGENGLVTDWSQKQTQAAAPRDAQSVVGTLTRLVASARAGVVYTAETDPDRLLGRPDGYTSKVAFTDVRAGATDSPGSVEVFPTAALAESRRDLIRAAAAGVPTTTEYDFLVGEVLVRVPGTLTPQQAVEYQTAVQGQG